MQYLFIMYGHGWPGQCQGLYLYGIWCTVNIKKTRNQYWIPVLKKKSITAFYINSGAIFSVAARAVCLPTDKIQETQEGNPGAATLVTFSELQNGPRPIDVKLPIPMNKNIAAPCAMKC